MKISFRRDIGATAGIILGLIIISAIVAIWQGPLSALRMVFGTVLVLFVPGFCVTGVLFPFGRSSGSLPGSEEMPWLTRLVLALCLSIALVPSLSLALYYWLGVQINFNTVLAEITSLSLVGALLTWLRSRR